MLKRFSVTAVKTFRDCPRKFFDQYILGKKGPPSIYLERGDKMDRAVEFLVKGQSVPEALFDYRFYAEALRPFFAPPEEEVLVQEWFELPTQFGIPFVGKMDYTRPFARPSAKLLDWKSTSNPRYMLTPEEVRGDIQTNVYSRYLFEEGLDVPLVGGLVYVHLHPENRPPKSVSSVKVVPVLVDILEERTKKIWDELQVDLEAMLVLSEETDRDRARAEVSACGKFGGCPYQVDCGISPALLGAEHRAKKTTKKAKGDDLMGFRDRVRGNGNGQNGQSDAGKQAAPPPVQKETVAAPAPAATGGYADRIRAKQSTQTVAPEPGQIVPNDAPPRDSGGADPLPVEASASETQAATQEAPRGRGRPKGSTSKKQTTAAAASEGFVLCVDCWPVKGYSEPTLFDDWIGPVLFELNQWAEEEKKVPHYQLLSFSEEKAAVSIAVQEKIAKGGLPGVLAISTSSQLARDVLPMLLPHASQVLRALR